MRPAKPGDPIEQHLTTRVFNSLVKKQGMKPVDLTKLHPLVPTIFKGHTTSDIQMYVPVGISGPALPNEDDGNLEYNEYYKFPDCTIGTSLTNHNWAVTQGPCCEGSPAICVLEGLTWVKADVTDLEHKWLKVVGGNLVSDESAGKAYIITPPEDTGVGYCLVLLTILPTTIQTFITQLRVTEASVQYKERDIFVWADAPETDWLDLASVLCPEIP